METTITAKPRFNFNFANTGMLFLIFFSAICMFASPWLKRIETETTPSISLIPQLIGLVFLVSAVWVFAIFRYQKTGRIFILLASSTCLGLTGWPDYSPTGFLIPFWTFGLVFSTASLAYLFISLTQPPLLFGRRWLKAVLFVPALTLWALLMLSAFLPALGSIFPTIRFIAVIFSCLAVALSMGLTGLHYFQNSKSRSVNQSHLFLLIASLSILVPVIGFLSQLFSSTAQSFSPCWLISLIIFPPTAALALISQSPQLSGSKANPSLVHSILFLLMIVAYALLVTGAGLLFGNALGENSILIQGIIFFCLALAFLPMRDLLQTKLDKVYFRSSTLLEEQLNQFTALTSEQMELSSISEILQKSIQQALNPSTLHIFLFDPFSEQYAAVSRQGDRFSSDLRFSPNSTFINHLVKSSQPVNISEMLNTPITQPAEIARLKLLGVTWIIPIHGQKMLAGWLALGNPPSSNYYSPGERRFLQSLSDQAGLLIERTRIVNDMEKRVHEMNVLGRVAQGVNITLQMDDIFELIYAQTTQIIPADDFYLFLLHPETGELVDTFHVESNDRLTEKEQKSINRDQTLEEEVARSGRSLIVEDYAQEAHNRGISGERPGVKAWMAVPLNAGAGSIGVISLGQRDQSTPYSREQLNLLQRIADQAAGAIVKARLLTESEQRTRQLTTLNEVTRQLTSTLDLEPLLSIILDSATELLNCEAGSLLLVDPQTDELVFRVVNGPAKTTLTGKRMPPGAGAVGKSVKTRQPIIVSDVQSSPDWFKYVDEQTGFITRALMVIPMEVKGSTIGVIEVINKRGSSSFTQEDQNLLAAFASQAGIAIENARLYTMTDKALAARVEELSVMQRIDRELNASLEISKTLAITLDWALRQSHAAAGLICQMEDEELRIATTQGYTNELDKLNGSILSEYFSIQSVLESGSPLRLNLEGGLLPSSRTLAIIPIRREKTTIGILLLETPEMDALDVNTMAFLTRLTDHASIAISNAQLYAAVQAANAAKSEFVSFVSHELKNPMTSIKGYTELLAAGAVGPINEAQTNFLNTIRSNVERMSTLVSDLNDVSRIEANRMRLDFKAQVVSEVVDETIRSLRKQIEDKGQTLNIQLPANLPPVWGDRTRLAQILINLVSNAHKYTTQGGTITVAAEVCDNQWDPAGAKRVVHLSIKDTGIGISPEDQKKIFQKFFRSEDPKTREAPGTGLGLNITRSLVELQGGRIWFESEFRVGTTFHFTMPLAD